MNTLFGTLIAILMLGTGTAYAGGALMSSEDCRDTLYTEGGARSLRDAAEVCKSRSDEQFVSCVTWNYQDSDQDHSFETAVNLCRARIPGAQSMESCQLDLVRQAGIPFNLSGAACVEGRSSQLLSCVKNLDANLDFNPQRAAQLCEWTTDRSIYSCAIRTYRGKSVSNENAVRSCYNQYDRGELTANGENKLELAEAARQEARRRQAEEQRRQQQEAEQRRQQNPPPAPPPTVRTTPTAPAAPAKPAPPVKSTEPVKPAPTKPAPAKPAPQKPAPATPAKPATPAAPVATPDQPIPQTPKCADGTNDCNGVIVDLPNL